MREDCRTPNPVFRYGPITVNRNRVGEGEGEDMRQEAASEVYRESQGLRQGGKICAYGWRPDNPGRNSVVRERENRRFVNSCRGQEFPSVVCERPKSQRPPHLLGIDRAESQGGGVDAETIYS